MTPVFQTTNTNCLSACIASVLEIPLTEVPDFWLLTGGEWVDALRDFASAKRVGFCYFDLKDRKTWPILDGLHLVVGGTTKRSTEYLHAVVAKGRTENGTTTLEYVHDPYDKGDYIDEPDHCFFFIPKNTPTNR